MLKEQEKQIFDGLGRPIKTLTKGVRYKMIDHGYYTTALKPGETDAIRPVLPDEEQRYLDAKLKLKRMQ